MVVLNEDESEVGSSVSSLSKRKRDDRDEPEVPGTTTTKRMFKRATTLTADDFDQMMGPVEQEVDQVPSTVYDNKPIHRQAVDQEVNEEAVDQEVNKDEEAVDQEVNKVEEAVEDKDQISESKPEDDPELQPGDDQHDAASDPPGGIDVN